MKSAVVLSGLITGINSWIGANIAHQYGMGPAVFAFVAAGLGDMTGTWIALAIERHREAQRACAIEEQPNTVDAKQLAAAIKVIMRHQDPAQTQVQKRRTWEEAVAMGPAFPRRHAHLQLLATEPEPLGSPVVREQTGRLQLMA